MKILAGKTAIITGSAKGIGAAIARLFAENGANVVINYRKSREAARKLNEEISSTGAGSIAVKADVSNPDEAKMLIQTAVKSFGRIDILVNNAGDFLYKSIEDTSVEEWRGTIENNLHSTFYCIKESLDDMRKRSWGRIINIADARADKLNAQPLKTAYSIAKTGIIQLTRSFAVTGAKYGITVNAISPGYIDCGNYSEKFIKSCEERIPAGKLGTPEDIAQTALFLVSDSASYITGANIEVAGGAEL